MHSEDDKINATSEHNAFKERFHYLPWIVATSVNLASLCFLTWMTTGLIAYGKRSKFKHLNGADRLRRQGAIVCVSAVVAEVSLFVFLALDVAYYNVGYGRSSSRACELVMDTTFAFCKFSSFLILMYFWLRQRALYSHQVMAELKVKTSVRVVKWTTLALMAVGPVIEIIGFTVPDQSRVGKHGCATVPPKQMVMWPVYLNATMYLTSQWLIFLLFMYPLRQSSKRRKVNRPEVNAAFRRNALVVMMSIASTLVTIIVPPRIDLGPSIHLMEMCFEIHLMFLAFTVVFSFKRWREIMWSCKSQHADKPSGNHSTISASSNLR